MLFRVGQPIAYVHQDKSVVESLRQGPAAARSVLTEFLRFPLLGLPEAAGGDAVFRGKPVFGRPARLERRRKRRRGHGNGLRPRKRPGGLTEGCFGQCCICPGGRYRAGQHPQGDLSQDLWIPKTQSHRTHRNRLTESNLSFTHVDSGRYSDKVPTTT